MDVKVEMVTVDATNVAERRFFCYKSKPKTKGYEQKLAWLTQRFQEGLKIQIIYENGRSVGFIEYIPGEFAWRSVKATNYMVIHCLWVVGRGKDKGYGSRLLHACVEEARQSNMAGVAMVASSGNWLAGKKVLIQNGFVSVDQSPPSFELLVKKFAEAPSPTFPQDWDERLRRYGPELTIIRSNQCPYIYNSIQAIWATAQELGIETQVITLENCQEAQDLAPSAYGVFNVVYNGELLTYHPIGKGRLLQLLEGYRK